MRKLKFYFIAFLIIVTVLGFYYWQRNIYSKDILKLEILGPEEAELLEEIEYIVKYKNNGNTRLEEPELIFEYPEYSIPVGEDSLRITKNSEDLGGAIYPGEEKTFKFKARLLGKEGEDKQAKATLSSRPKNLKARYKSDTTFTTIIKKVPLTFEFDTPATAEAGKDFRLQLNYFSNTNYPIPNLRITIEYPRNFEFVESIPKSLEKTEWDIGSLNKADGGRIEIVGKLRSSVGSSEVFQAKIGSWQNGEFVLLKTVAKGIDVGKPALRITQYINNNPEYIASPGDLLHYEIFFRNIGESALSDMFIVSNLEGDAFDFTTLKSEYGEFESGDNSVIFDWRRIPGLQFLAPQEEGKVEFWINLKDGWNISAETKNPVLKNRIIFSQIREEFVTKVNSKVEIEQKGYFQDEVFGNSGPLPPEVGNPTTYTITWNVKNYYSEIRNAKMKAILPEQVKPTGEIFPEDQSDKLAYDSGSREIVWEIGDLAIGEGVLTPSPNISFQVSFIPTSSQVGNVADLIGQVTMTGQDQWTDGTISANALKIDTTLPDDQAVSPDQSIVK